MTYIPSQVLPGDTERLRQHAFTRWMSRDLLQAATDFCRNIGLHAIYSETAPGRMTRYLFWNTPQDSRFEIRSGRTREQFAAFDSVNNERNLSLLSLHVSGHELYSAVWISHPHFDTAVAVLAAYGITPAQRIPPS